MSTAIQAVAAACAQDLQNLNCRLPDDGSSSSVPRSCSGLIVSIAALAGLLGNQKMYQTLMRSVIAKDSFEAAQQVFQEFQTDPLNQALYTAHEYAEKTAMTNFPNLLAVILSSA